MFRIIDGDMILYETNLGLNQKEVTVTHHLIMHGALDYVQEQQQSTQNMYLRQVEQSQEQGTFAYITASNIKFLILIGDKQSEDSIKRFFTEVYELYVKNLMNPLYKVGTKITSYQFDNRIKMLITKFFQMNFQFKQNIHIFYSYKYSNNQIIQLFIFYH